MAPSDHRPDRQHPERELDRSDAGPAEPRTPPARPDERGEDDRRADRISAGPERAADRGEHDGGGGRSRGTSAEAPEEIAGQPGTTQHVPPDGVPPGAERRDRTEGGGTSEGGGSS
jgi:hypothetical protein